MLRLLTALITLPLAALFVSFAATNRQLLEVGLWPLAHRVEVPVYAIVLVPLALSFLIGGLVAWVGGHEARTSARAERRRADRLAADLQSAEDRAETAEKRLAEMEAAERAPAPAPALTALAPPLETAR